MKQKHQFEVPLLIFDLQSMRCHSLTKRCTPVKYHLMTFGESSKSFSSSSHGESCRVEVSSVQFKCHGDWSFLWATSHVIAHKSGSYGLKSFICTRCHTSQESKSREEIGNESITLKLCRENRMGNQENAVAPKYEAGLCSHEKFMAFNCSTCKSVSQYQP